jgi:hypothetical protein
MRLRLPAGSRNEATRSERIASPFAARGRPARSLDLPAEGPSCCTLIQRLQCALRELAIVSVSLYVQEGRDPRCLALDGGRGCRRRTSFERVPGEGGRNGCLSLGRTPGLMFHGVTVRLGPCRVRRCHLQRVRQAAHRQTQNLRKRPECGPDRHWHGIRVRWPLFGTMAEDYFRAAISDVK